MSSESLGACPLCDGADREPVHRELRGALGVDRCRGCGLLTCHPYPSAETLRALYDDAYFANADLDGVGFDYAAIRRGLEATYRRNLKLLRAVVPSGRLLELGCAEGDFLRQAKALGYDPQGVELAAGAAARAAAHAGVPVHPGTLQDFASEPGQWDCIAAWDVIEHIPDPKALLDRCTELLKPGGVLAATVPDVDSWTHGVLGAKWFGWNALREHPCYYPRATLRRALEERGFEVVRAGRWPWSVPAHWLLRRLPLGAVTAPLSKLLAVGYCLVPFPWINQIIVARKR